MPEKEIERILNEEKLKAENDRLERSKEIEFYLSRVQGTLIRLSLLKYLFRDRFGDKIGIKGFFIGSDHYRECDIFDEKSQSINEFYSSDFFIDRIRRNHSAQTYTPLLELKFQVPDGIKSPDHFNEKEEDIIYCRESSDGNSISREGKRWNFSSFCMSDRLFYIMEFFYTKNYNNYRSNPELVSVSVKSKTDDIGLFFATMCDNLKKSLSRQ